MDHTLIALAFSGIPVPESTAPAKRTVEELAEGLGGVRFDRHKDGSIASGTAKPTQVRLPSVAALHNAARARNRWPIGHMLTEPQYRDALAQAGRIRLT